MTPNEVNVRIAINVTDDLCAGLMCTALEGGIGYWCAAGEIERRDVMNGSFEYVSFNAYDDEDQTLLGKVDYSTIRLGVARILSGDVPVRKDIKDGLLLDLLENELGCRTDVEAADCVVQAGLLNEIVYG